MLCIKNARVVPVTGAVLEKGDILINQGKIVKIGANLSHEGCEVMDASGLTALPGLIDTHTHIGGFDPLSSEAMDLNEMTDPITPHMRGIDGIDISSENFKAAVKAGVTAVCITPGSGNVIAGHAFATKTYGKNIYDMALKSPCQLKIAFGGNPKGVYGTKGKAPMTRMGIASMMRDTFKKAKDYMEKKEAAGDDKSKVPPYDQKLEAIIPVLKQEISLKIHCEQFDMLTAMGIAKEFGCKFTIDHAWLAYEHYDDLVAGGGSIMFGPIGIPNGYGEIIGADVFCVNELDKRGLNVTLVTDAPVYSIDNLIVMAGEAVRWGTPHDRALRMITINGAKALGLEDRIGSLEEGKDADIALFDAMPALDTRASVVCTIVDGNVVYRK